MFSFKVLEEHETRLDSVDGTLLANEGQLQSHDQVTTTDRLKFLNFESELIFMRNNQSGL
jgi:hypothetical protein